MESSLKINAKWSLHLQRNYLGMQSHRTLFLNVNPHTSLEISHGPRLLICSGNLPRPIVIESRMTQHDTTGTVCNLLIVINSFYTSVNKVGIVPFKRVTCQSYKCIELGLKSTINLFIIDHTCSISARTSN